MGNQRLDPFIREGIAKYRDAYDAITAFRDELERRLRDVLESKRKWAVFKPGAVRTGHGGRGAEGCWIYATCEEIRKKGVSPKLELGVWWGAKSHENEAVLYCGFSEGSDFHLRPSISTKGRVRPFPYKDRIYAAMVLDPSDDIAAAAHAVIDTVDTAMGMDRGDAMA